jgi:hypothetical protein
VGDARKIVVWYIEVEVDVGSDDDLGCPVHMRFIKMAIPPQASTPKEVAVN